MDTSGIIFDIKRYAIHDGPGIRTTVFLKGCPLNCLWCHNPQSISPKPETAFYRDRCVSCGQCAEGCPFGARKLIGRAVTVGDVMETVRRDAAYYANSGGGLTISGGEPLMKPQFTLGLLRQARAETIHTCVDTSGYAPFQTLKQLIPFTDLFLFDIKETDDEKHRAATGVGNARILDNLRRLDHAGAQILLRCPIVPGLNDRADHFDAIRALASELIHVEKVEILPFHPYGSDTAEAVGRPYPLKELKAPSPETVAEWERAVQL
jgi:pyruvate formate lyase activating enzyme